MSFTHRRRIVALALGALITSCSGDSSVGPSSGKPTDLNQVLAEMSLPALSGVAVSLAPTAGTSFGAPTSSSCTYSSATQSFVCPTTTASGITITQSYILLDAAGVPQSVWNATTIAAVRMKMTAKGTLTSPGTTLTIDETLDQTLSGLLTGTHVMNGTSVVKGSGTVASGGVTQPLSYTLTMTMENLALPNAVSAANAYPTSGRMVMDMSGSGGGSVSYATHMEMTFNGTSKVAVVMTTNGITTRCTMDLANPTTAICS